MLGVEAEVAGFAQEYAFYLYLAMGFHMQFDCYRQYLNATGRSKVI